VPRPISFQLERRLEPPRWSRLTPLFAIACALILGALILAFVGGDPVRSYLHIFKAAFGSTGVISDTLVKATRSS
jgi:simple sugar transport system permease protein